VSPQQPAHRQGSDIHPEVVTQAEDKQQVGRMDEPHGWEGLEEPTDA